jgi:hypothetical protein
MTGKDFLRAVANGRTDIVQTLLDILEESGAGYCLIGGLAVNAYAEPVVSLDLDLVVVADRLPAVGEAARKRGLAVEEFEHSVNLSAAGSDLRIQLRTDPRYQEFLGACPGARGPGLPTPRGRSRGRAPGQALGPRRCGPAQ